MEGGKGKEEGEGESGLGESSGECLGGGVLVVDDAWVVFPVCAKWSDGEWDGECYSGGIEFIQGAGQAIALERVD